MSAAGYGGSGSYTNALISAGGYAAPIAQGPSTPQQYYSGGVVGQLPTSYYETQPASPTQQISSLVDTGLPNIIAAMHPQSSYNGVSEQLLSGTYPSNASSAESVGGMALSPITTSYPTFSGLSTSSSSIWIWLIIGAVVLFVLAGRK